MARGETKVAVTPDRELVLDVDLDETTLREPAFSQTYHADEIAAGVPEELHENVRLIPGIGWTLEEVVRVVSEKREIQAGQSAIMTVSGGMLQVADGHEEADTYRRHTGTGITYRGGAATTGDPYVQKHVPAGSSFDDRLSADQTAFPGPSDSADATDVDRVARTVQDSTERDAWQFNLEFPAARHAAPRTIARFHFVSYPASSPQGHIGSGRYCIEVRSDGILRLYEKQVSPTTDWILIRGLRLDSPQAYRGKVMSINVRSIPPSGKRYDGGAIEITTESGSPTVRNRGITSKGFDRPSQTDRVVHRIPRWNEEVQKPEPAPARVDIRRDQRPRFQIIKHYYPTTGKVRGAVFGLTFYPEGTTPVLEVRASGDLPSGTAMVPKLYNAADDTELTLVDSGTGWRQYQTVADQRYYYPEVELTSNATDSPIVRDLQALRDPVTVVNSPGDFSPQNPATSGVAFRSGVLDVKLRGAQQDPSTESGYMLIEDVTGENPRLNTRGDLNFALGTKWDPLDDTRIAYLMRGRIISPEGYRKGADTGKYGGENWTAYRCNLVGNWHRLSVAQAPVRFNWHGPDGSATPDENGIYPPFKATDAVRTMLQWAGFPPSMINVPDKELRLWPDDKAELYIEPLQPLGDYINKIVREYLGMRLVFDPNAGDFGKWRVLEAPTAPYTNLASFQADGPGAGKAVHNTNSYGEIATGRPKTFYQRGTLRKRVEPPEGNLLIVSGKGGVIDGNNEEVLRLTQIIFNPRSFNFYNLAPAHAHYPDADHPDYLGYVKRIVITDAGLTTPEAVNWFARRVADLALLGIKTLSFTAPLVLVHDEDDEELTTPSPIRYRPLRFYDPVLVDGVQFLVRRVSPAFTKDHVMLAEYEVEAPREPFLEQS